MFYDKIGECLERIDSMRHKMKRMQKQLLLGLLLFCSLVTDDKVLAQEDLLAITQKAGYSVTAEDVPTGAIVIDAESGQILYDFGSETVHDPASTTKAMVAYLTFQAISNGVISLDTEVTANETDQAIADIYALSNSQIVSGVRYTVRDLLSMTMVQSSNGATLMLAHAIHTGGDHSFLDLMNQTAQDLGMSQTYFTNATGATAESFDGYYQPDGYDATAPSTSTAKDMAILTYRLLKDYPEILTFTSQRSVTIMAGTEQEQVLTSSNHSLSGDEKAGIEGVDGLKTGSSPTADYNTIVTAKRGDVRLICIIFGASQWDNENGEYIRHYFANALLENTFATYSRQIVASKGQIEVKGVTVEVASDLYGLAQKEEAPSLEIRNSMLGLALTVDPSYGVSLVEKKIAVKTVSSEKNEPWYIAEIVSALVFFITFLMWYQRSREEKS